QSLLGFSNHLPVFPVLPVVSLSPHLLWVGLALHPLKDLVMLPIHPEPRVDLLGRRVSPIHVEPDSSYPRVNPGQPLAVRVEPGRDDPPARSGRDLDALNPPDETGAPVAPLVGDEGRADDPPR